MLRDYIYKKNIHLIGAGFEKCGTTSLNDMLSKSREILSPLGKETFFFSKNFDRGYDWYEAQYAKDAAIKGFDDQSVVLDITPSYFRYPTAIDRIARDLERALFLFVVRRPISRAYSAYLHQIYHGICFGGEEYNLFDSRNDRSFFYQLEKKNSFVYHDFHKAYEQVINKFGPDRVLVVALEDIIEDTNGFVSYLSKFLDRNLNKEMAHWQLPRSNRLYLPEYAYSKAEGRNYNTDEGIFRLMGPALYIFRNGLPYKLGKPSLQKVRNAFALESTWTTRLDPEFAYTLEQNIFASDFRWIGSLKGSVPKGWATPLKLQANPIAPFSASAKALNPGRFLAITKHHRVLRTTS